MDTIPREMYMTVCNSTGMDRKRRTNASINMRENIKTSLLCMLIGEVCEYLRGEEIKIT